ncbi:hypothetical protein DYH55_02280 [Methylovirgula sp. 4M-Z18]|nr:hypothetical protein DYH55_02280 [Methylovirgula sp. 4M-Z18]
MEIPVEKLGFPGSLIELHLVPQFPNVTRRDQDILTDDSEREFEAAALLSKAPSPVNALDFQFTEADGDSYFVFALPGMAVDTQWGRVIVGRNANSEASIVKMRCWARSANEALDRLQLACAAFLDHWAYEATAPVYLTRLRARDLTSKSEMVRFSRPFQLTAINPSATEIPTPLRPILALYREGLGSASPIYKFLCFYKILEGYLTRLKPDLAKLFRAAELPYPVPPDRVPDHPDLDESFRAHIGQSITKFRDELLTPGFRNAVAHFEKDGLSPLVMSNPNEIVRFSTTAVAVELCARAVIEAYRLAFRTAMDAGLDLSTLAETGGQQ